MARAAILRHMEAPQICAYYIEEEPGVGFHFEVHQGGAGHPMLPDVLKKTAGGASVVIGTRGRQAEVARKSNGSLMCTLLTNQESLNITEKWVPTKGKMTPFVRSNGHFMAVAWSFLAVSCAALIAGALSLAAKQSLAQGYIDDLSGSPSSALVAELLKKGSVTTEDVSDTRLPIDLWAQAESISRRGDVYVAKLEYDPKRLWQVTALPLSSLATSEPEAPSEDGLLGSIERELSDE